MGRSGFGEGRGFGDRACRKVSLFSMFSVVLFTMMSFLTILSIVVMTDL
jgi:hypothetical protein